MKKIGCQIENVRWDVDDYISAYGNYETACKAFGLPHYVLGMDVAVQDDDKMKDIKEAVISALSKKHRFEAIDVEISEIFER